jgi:hypothetical protein
MAIKLNVKPELPDNPKFLDRVEYALEWWIYCVIVDLPGKTRNQRPVDRGAGRASVHPDHDHYCAALPLLEVT